MIIKNVRLATTVFLSIQTLNKCLCCNKDHQYKFDKKLMELFFNTYKFSNLDNNKFTLLFQKSVYSYQYMDDWEKLNQTSLPEKKIYGHINMEDLTDANYAHTKEFVKVLI